MRMKERKRGGRSRHKDVLDAEAAAFALVCKQLDWLVNWSIDSVSEHPLAFPALPAEDSPRLAEVIAARKAAQRAAIGMAARSSPVPSRTETELIVVLLTLRRLIDSYATKCELAVDEKHARRPGRPKAKGLITVMPDGSEVELYSAEQIKMMESVMLNHFRSRTPDGDVDAYCAVEDMRLKLSSSHNVTGTITAAIHALIDSGDDPLHERERQFNSLRGRYRRGKKKAAARKLDQG